MARTTQRNCFPFIYWSTSQDAAENGTGSGGGVCYVVNRQMLNHTLPSCRSLLLRSGVCVRGPSGPALPILREHDMGPRHAALARTPPHLMPCEQGNMT